MSDLPPGFVLDNQPRALPPGFVLDGKAHTSVPPVADGGGVEDAGPVARQAPMRGDIINPVNLPHDEAAGYFTTRIKNALTGTAEMLATGGKFGRMAKPVPVQQKLNALAEGTIPTVNGNPVVDAGIEMGLGSLALGGGASSVVPSFLGGAASERLGEATKGTQWEPAARFFGAMLAGGGGALVQSGAQSGGRAVVQGVKNAFGAGADETAARILARNLQRDKMTPDQLTARQADLGPGTPLVEAGGPNVRGMVRGSIAKQGEARTTTQELFDGRRVALPERTNNALDEALTSNRSLGITVEDLAAARSAAATPLYEAAGIPDQPKMLRPERTVRFSVNEPPTTLPAEWNTPSFSSPELERLMSKSADVKTAIGAARGLPDYQDLPANSMALLDKAYKHLNGLEQEAVRGGNLTRVHDLKHLRQNFGAAIAEVNPRYGRALDAYSGPSKLIDAAETGKEWMTKGIDQAVVARQFQAMSPAEQNAAKIGIRDWARTAVERTRVGVPSDQVFGTAGMQARLKAVLGDAEYAALEKQMAGVKNTANTITDINVGSRTAPMLAEAGDNAMQAGAVASELVRGRPIKAAMKFTGNVLGRIAEGKTEAVNARLAEIARITDPAQVGMVAAMANRAALENAARAASRQNALFYGIGVPAAGAATGARR